MANTSGYGYLLGPAPQFFDANGKPLVGGKLFVYIAGTTTTAVTYSDFNRTENTSPVVLNDLGTCMLIVPSANLYKIVLYDRNGNLLLTRDNVSVSSEQQIIYTTANKVESSDSTVDVTATTDPDTGIITYDLSIQNEIDRATETEKGLAESIEAEKKRAEGAESTLSKSIADETERATGAEKGLADAIEAEKTRAEGAESTLSKSIADETDRAIAAEKASRTEIVAGDNITVDKTTGEDGHDIYTINGEKGEYTHIDAATANPLMDGTAAVGVSVKYAREDHVHPTDTSMASASHTHGNIQNGGTLQTNDITIANGDKLVVTDSSDSSKVSRASLSFDGSTTTQALTKAGTWATFNNYSHPAGSAPSKTGVPTANATPGFGGTFKVNQITTDATSHVSAVTERTITIPNATATTSVAGLMSAADKKKLDGIATGAEANVQADWNITDSSSDAFIKNKPYFNKYIGSPGIKIKVCTVVKYNTGGTGSDGIEVFYRRGSGAVHGHLLHKATFELYLERIGDVSANTNTVKFYYVENSSTVDIYAESDAYCLFTAAPLANMPKDRIDFTNFGTNVDSIPEGAVAINPVWVANSSASSGTAPVKVDAYGNLTAVPMDSIPTASSTNLMTSGDIKTAIDKVNAKGLTIKKISGEQVICFE